MQSVLKTSLATWLTCHRYHSITSSLFFVWTTEQNSKAATLHCFQYLNAAPVLTARHAVHLVHDEGVSRASRRGCSAWWQAVGWDTNKITVVRTLLFANIYLTHCKLVTTHSKLDRPKTHGEESVLPPWPPRAPVSLSRGQGCEQTPVYPLRDILHMLNIRVHKNILLGLVI